MIHRRRHCLEVASCGVLLSLTGALAMPLRAADWPQWRGALRNGTTPERLRREGGVVSLGDPVWQQTVGEGCGSVVVVGARVYAMGWRDGKDMVCCLDSKDGRVLWSRSYSCSKYGRHATGDQGFYSGPTSTPTLDEDSGLLYTLGADGDLRCWDTSKEGAGLWAVNLYDQYRAGQRPNVGGGLRDYGYTTAPLASEDLLLVPVGGDAGLLLALDKRTGEKRWASSSKDFVANAGGISPIQVGTTPAVAVLSLNRLVVVRTDRGHAGETLAEYPWQTDFANNLVTPTVVGSSVLLSSGYNLRTTVLVDIADGRVTRRWESRHHTGVCSPVVHEGRIYAISDRLFCLSLADGTLLWEAMRCGPDGSCLVTGDGYVLVWASGQLTIVNSAADHPPDARELARRSGLCSNDEAWPAVVFAAGRIYCKDRRGKVMCFVVEP